MMKFILAVFAFVSAAFADKPASTPHSSKETNTTQPRARAHDVEPPGQVVTQTSEDLKTMESTIRELNAFGPTRQVGEVDVPDESLRELPQN